MMIGKLFIGLLLFGVVVFSLDACASKKQVTTKKPTVTAKTFQSPPKQSQEPLRLNVSERPLSSAYVTLRLFLKDLSKGLSSWHPYVAPFPVVLLILAPWFFVLNWIKHRLEFAWMVKFCLWGGFLTSLLAVLSGHSTSAQVSLPQTQHAIAVEFVFWMSGLSVGIRYFTLRWQTKLWVRIPIALLLFLTSFLTLYSVHLSSSF